MDGFQLGPLVTNYTIDAFYDHLCSDSSAAFPGLYEYWQENQNWLGFRIHIYPLPYHHFSFVVAQAGRYIQLNYTSKFIPFVNYWFQHQQYFLQNYQSWDFNTINIKVAGMTADATGVNQGEILVALNDDNVNWSSRVSYKYASFRTMPGTPLYLVNDVWVPETADFVSADDWSNFFAGLDN